MILNRRHGLAFVHIPKCAGTSVRVQLAPYDDCDGAFSGAGHHPDLTRNELIHLTAAQIETHFPEILEELFLMDVYAVTRNPHERFRSAVTQHLRAVYNQRVGETSPEMLYATIDGILATLSDTSGPLPGKYVHFTRQSDYVLLRDRRLVDHLYRVEDLGALFGELSRRLGTRLQPEARMNQNLDFRLPAIEEPMWKANALLSKYLPQGVYRAAKRMVTPIVARRAIAAEKASVFDAPSISAFVERHYARDFELYEQAGATGADLTARP